MKYHSKDGNNHADFAEVGKFLLSVGGCESNFNV
jgi:hypothetical protein